jgi:hypothetical protein
MDNQTDGKETKARKVRNPIGGSKPLEITPAMFEHAGRCALTWKHVAGILGVSFETVANRMKDPAFREAYERGKVNSQSEVIQTLFAHMRQGSVKAAVFLAQAWCGLSTRHEVKSEETTTTKYVVETVPTSPSLEAWSQAHVPAPAVIEEAKRVN